MKIILFGHQNWGLKAVETLVGTNNELVQVYTHPLEMDKHENVWYESVKNKCEKLRIPVEERTNLTSIEEKKIKEISPDIIISAGWRKLIPKPIFEIPKFGAVNVHDSLIPKYRGFAPINWAIINGEKEAGITFHYIDEGADTGDIILQKTIPVSIEETATDIYNKLLSIFPDLLKKTIEQKNPFSKFFWLIDFTLPDSICSIVFFNKSGNMDNNLL